MSEPLYVLEYEHGDLFLSGEETCRESTSPVMLTNTKLWDAYVEACNKMNRARRAVVDALRVPSPPTQHHQQGDR